MPAFTLQSPPVVPQAAREEPTDYWARAVDGRPQEAYAGLAEFARRPAARPVHFAQLYWLASLYPDAAGKADPRAWLQEGIGRFGWVPPLAELLRRELRADPRRALDPGYLALGKVPHREGGCPPYYEYRFRALYQLQNSAKFEWDFEDLGRAGLDLDDGTLLAVLCRMFEYAAWMGGGEPRIDDLLAAISNRLNEFPMRPDREHLIERCEAAQAVRRALRAVQQAEGAVPFLSEMLAAFWLDGAVGDSAASAAFLNGIDRRPLPYLETLDRIADLAPGILALLRSALCGELWQREDFLEPRAGPWFARQIGRLLAVMKKRSNRESGAVASENFRRGLIALCLAERVPFDWATRTLRENFPGEAADADVLDRDAAAQCLCLAYRLAGLI